MEWIIGIIVLLAIIGWISNAINGGGGSGPGGGGGGGGGKKIPLPVKMTVAGVAGYKIGKGIAKL